MIIMYGSERVTEWFKNLMFKGGVFYGNLILRVSVPHWCVRHLNLKVMSDLMAGRLADNDKIER